jgi:hypothetical protein
MPGDTPSEQTQIGWQRQALDVLSRLLDLADDSGLPAITWTVHAIDRGPGLTGHSPGDEQHPAFRAWHEAITAIAGPEHPDHGSAGSERAFYYWGKVMGVTLMLDADLPR